MLEPYLQTLKRKLFLKGIWGNRVRRLEEEISDHYFSFVERYEKEGMPAGSAQKRALESLGSEESVAETTVKIVRSGSFFAGHPWMAACVILVAGGCGMAILAGLISLLLSIICSFLEITPSSSAWAPVRWVLETTYKWIPVVGGTVGLAMWAARFAAGWRALILASFAVGVVGSSLYLSIESPLDHNHQYSVVVVAWSPIVDGVRSLFQISQADSGVKLSNFLEQVVRLFMPVVMILALRVLCAPGNKIHTSCH